MTPPLDSHQQRACEAPERLVRILAGAGSGKTHTLLARARWLVEQGVRAHRILIVTFSKAAAETLKERLGDTLIDARTVHSLGYAILRDAYPGRGVANDYASRRLIREALRAAGAHGVPFADAVRAIRYAKGTNTPIPQALVATLDLYERALGAAKQWDYEDMILVAVQALANEALASLWRGKFDAILVDEMQDTSRLQWDLIAALIAPTTRVTVVGDLSQSIYKFRGADPGGVLHYLVCALGAFTEYRLPRNYRSDGTIVSLANELIRGRAGAIELEATHAADVAVNWLLTADAQAQAALALAALGEDWAHCAILYRLNSQSEAIESLCIREGTPYRIAGVNFYARTEVLDALAYLKLAQGWDHEALDRIYNRPSRYLGKAWREELEDEGGWDALIAGRARFSRRYMDERSVELIACVRETQRYALIVGATPASILAFALERSGYRKWLLGEEPDAEDEARGANLDALLEAASHWETIDEGLALAGVAREQDSVADALTLSTIHRAKGLEWDSVAVLGVQDGVLPHARGDLDEERRIAYVAFTRAKRHLILLRSDGGEGSSLFWPSKQEEHANG